ncbi:MAG: TatD family hydrolase [Candidatus Colwellbacteria bacterium]|nr:TatD family hydrolase [Candidatus Colwellbacteria bacterium]
MPRLFDVHTHTQFAAYEGDSKEVIDRALSQDIWVLNVGTQKDTSLEAVKIAEGYAEGVYATVGLHPIHTEKSYHDGEELGAAPTGGEPRLEFYSRREDFDYGYYLNLGGNKKVVAVGECGLDYYRLSGETREKQTMVFEEQIRLAQELKKPLMIHCRQAFTDLIEVLRSNRGRLNNPPGLVHFFTGTAYDARNLLELGFSFSFGGVVTFARDYDDALKFIPLKNILLETDAPYVSPIPFRGKRNEPANIVHIAKQVAEIKGVSLEEAERTTTDNARKLFRV